MADGKSPDVDEGKTGHAYFISLLLPMWALRLLWLLGGNMERGSGSGSVKMASGCCCLSVAKKLLAVAF